MTAAADEGVANLTGPWCTGPEEAIAAAFAAGSIDPAAFTRVPGRSPGRWVFVPVDPEGPVVIFVAVDVDATRGHRAFLVRCPA